MNDRLKIFHFLTVVVDLVAHPIDDAFLEALIGPIIGSCSQTNSDDLLTNSLLIESIELTEHPLVGFIDYHHMHGLCAFSLEVSLI